MTRTTVATLIDSVRTRLGDNGTTVSRTEILRWIEDGYGRLIHEARTPCILQAHDVPPKVSYGITHDWERQYVQGTTRKFTHSHHSGRYECTYLHETSTHAGSTAITSQGNVSQLWLLQYVDDTLETPYRFALPRRHDLLSVWYDYRLLMPITGDSMEGQGAWWDIGGLPYLYTTDETHNEFDLYAVVTSSHGGYTQDRPIGLPRRISGARTYTVNAQQQWSYAFTSSQPLATAYFSGVGKKVGSLDSDNGYWQVQASYTYPWEAQFASELSIDDTPVTLGLGSIRGISSPDRQYHNPISWQRYGTIRSWASAEDNLITYSAMEPQRLLSESDTLDMVPKQFEKYLRFYALAMIHNRQGELYEPNMAAHYRIRFQRGVILLSRIRNVAYRDTEYTRDAGRPRGAIGRPMLPDNYPRTTWR